MLYLLYFLVIFVLTGLDQLTKFYINQNFNLYESKVIINSFFDITYIQNNGAGFSILQDQRIFLCLISIIAFFILGYLLITNKKNDYIMSASFLLIMSGTLGNLIDRIRYGYVIDFLDFNLIGYDFPVFNVADCFITIGCFIIILSILRESKNAKN